MRISLIMAIATAMLLSTAVLASATPAQLTIVPLQQNIDVGTIGTYEVTLTTNDEGVGQAVLSWSTESPLVVAQIDGNNSMAQFGQINIAANGKEQKFILSVKPQDGVQVNKEYDVQVQYNDKTGNVKALVTGGVVPIPELSSMALMTVGLIGLVGLRKLRRRD